MKTAELSDLTAHPERLTELVESGEPTQIVKDGKALASIVPFPRTPGTGDAEAALGPSSPEEKLAALEIALTVNGPTCDIEQMLDEIESGGNRSSWP